MLSLILLGNVFARALDMTSPDYSYVGRYDHLSSKLGTLESQIQTVEADLAQKQADITELGVKLDELKAKREKRKRKFDSFTKDHSGKVEAERDVIAKKQALADAESHLANILKAQAVEPTPMLFDTHAEIPNTDLTSVSAPYGGEGSTKNPEIMGEATPLTDNTEHIFPPLAPATEDIGGSKTDFSTQTEPIVAPADYTPSAEVPPPPLTTSSTVEEEHPITIKTEPGSLAATEHTNEPSTIDEKRGNLEEPAKFENAPVVEGPRSLL